MNSTDPLELITANGPLLVVITGPSGVGKDTVIHRLREIGPPCHVTITATTRPRRATEADGIDYFFISDAEHRRMVQAGEFLEHAIVYGYGYGTPRAPVRAALARGEDVLLRIDVQGANEIGRLAPGSIRIFLAPPTFAELEQRLRARKLDTPDVIERRLRTAHEEMARASESDYLVINADGRLDETVCEIGAIMRAGHRRIKRQRVVL